MRLRPLEIRFLSWNDRWENKHYVKNSNLIGKTRYLFCFSFVHQGTFLQSRWCSPAGELARAWQIFKENGGRSTMRWNTFTDVAFMETYKQAVTHMFWRKYRQSLWRLVEFREDIACFQNIQALVFRNFVSTLYQEHPTLLCSFIWILLMQISYSKLQILKWNHRAPKS